MKALSKIFRAKFQTEMQHAGLLEDIDPAVWSEAFVTDSRAVGDGESTLGYLSRYVFRVAISNARLISCEDARVKLRWKPSGSRRWRTMELGAMEFIRRFLQHVLPPGFQKVRHYGFLSTASALSHQDVRELVSTQNVESAKLASSSALKPASAPASSACLVPRCPTCGGRLVVVDITFRRQSFQNSR